MTNPFSDNVFWRLGQGLTGGDNSADGVAAWQDDSTMIDGGGRRAGRVEIGAGLGDERASAGWACGKLGSRVDLGVAILAELVHIERLHLADGEFWRGWGVGRRFGHALIWSSSGFSALRVD